MNRKEQVRILLTVYSGLVAFAAPASAQRTRENAVTSASDAFGSSVGNERIGLYSPYLARGFSPIQAGNVRLEGLYYDMQADLHDRLIGGATMRVGLTTQGYPFPAPTGIADYSLRKAGQNAVLSAVAGYNPFGGGRVELDGQLPVTANLSVAGGAAVSREELFYGGDRKVIMAAVIPRWKPLEQVEIVPFWGLADYRGQESLPIVFTDGAYLPPKIARREYFGPSWAKSGGRGINYGVLSTAQLAGWTLRGGVFRSLHLNDSSTTELLLNTTKNGIADRYLIADADRVFGSVSGEVRLSRQFEEGDRRHVFHMVVRGRKQDRRYGGGQTIDLGRSPIDHKVTTEEPNIEFGPQTRDRVHQFTAGVGYEGRWRDRGELSVGLQRTSYHKQVETQSAELPPSKDSPWLPNIALSVHASRKLVFYGSYTKGLEESPVAPQVARNKGEAPPAIITQQFDAGLRYALNENLRVVAGVFDVQKPNFGLDSTRLFRNLGDVRHRGIELSVAGTLARGLNVVAGTVLLDAEISGEAVEQQLVGRRPVGSIKRTTTANLDYQLPWVTGLSVDLGLESTSSRVADRQNTFSIPARSTLSLGGRYSFKLAGKPTMLRAQVANLTNSYGWVNQGEGFYYSLPRRLSLALTMDV